MKLSLLYDVHLNPLQITRPSNLDTEIRVPALFIQVLYDFTLKVLFDLIVFLLRADEGQNRWHAFYHGNLRVLHRKATLSQEMQS